MKIINLFCGPGGGKSTTAATMFAYLKNKGHNVELVREWIKDSVYENRPSVFENQFYASAKQYKKLLDLKNYGKVPLVITDSPLLLGIYYAKNLPYAKQLNSLLYKLNAEFDNTNVYINRSKKYETSGRVHSFEQSLEIDKFILDEFAPFEYILDGNTKSQLTLAKEIEKNFCK